MSLDVYLELDTPVWQPSETIPVRANGTIIELTREQWDQLYPGLDPIVLRTEAETNQVFHRNITSNLGQMARAAGIYAVCWRPQEIGITLARQLIEPLRQGLDALRANPELFRRYNPTNGWGDYEGLVAFVDAYLAACLIYPEAKVSVWR